MRKCIAVLTVLAMLAGIMLTGCSNSGSDRSWEKVREKGEITIGVDDNVLPMFTEEDETYMGFIADAATELSSRLEVNLKFKRVDKNSKKQELDKGGIDFLWSALPAWDESNEGIHFDKPYLLNRYVLVAAGYSPLGSLAEFEGKKVAVVADSAGEAALNAMEEFRSKLAEVVKRGNYEEAMAELKDGNVDAVVMDEASASYYTTMRGEGLKIIDETVSPAEYAVGFREKDKTLMDKIHETLVEMASERVLENISMTWFGKDMSGYKDEAAVKKFSAQFIGRFDFSDSYGPVFGWPGSYIRARFKGTGLKMAMKPMNPVERDNWLNIIIDGQEPVPIQINSENIYTIASSLEDGEHEVIVWKRTGASSGDLQFLGFVPEEGEMLPPPPRAERRIEFIGDSITCGYGNEASSGDEEWKASTENNYLAFSSVAARLLDAEQISVAWSGRGVYRNVDGTTENPMPQLYLRTTPKNTSSRWNFENWIPHAVVINLGTNDFSNPGEVDTDAFMKAYDEFLKFIRGNYPDAHIFCSVGPMNHRALEYVKKVVEDFNEQGDKKVHFVEIPLMDTETEGAGANWHPSVKTHQRMGEQIAEEIGKVLGW